MPPASYREQIAEKIRDKIRSGEWRPGQELPTTRELVAEFGVSKGTVEAAVDRLIATGWIRGHQGLRRYVADHPPVDPPPTMES
jgi:DNA-binding GntR family transcriptional regulator